MGDTEWTPPEAAIEPAMLAYRAAMRATDNRQSAITAALTAAYPAIVAEKDAEIERLRGAASDIERLTDTYTVEGTEIVLNRMRDLRRERDEAREALAAVAALADEWDSTPAPPPVLALRQGFAAALRTVLADHADTLANVKADDV